MQQTTFPPPAQGGQPVRPMWNPVEEAQRRAELEAAATELATPKRKRGKAAAPPPPDPTVTQQIRAIAAEMPVRQHKQAGEFRAVVVPRAITVTGFFLFFSFPAAFLYLNHIGHAPLMFGAFEPDEFAKRISVVMIGGGAVCMLVGWLWWGIAAALNSRHQAKWSVSPWYVPLTYFAVGGAAVLAGMSPRWLGDQAIYAKACALAFGIVMFFSTLGTYRTTAEAVGSETKFWTRLIAVPWVVFAAGGVVWWFWHYLPTQAILGAYVALQLIQGLYGLWMYQAMHAFDKACAGTRQMRQDHQEFAKFFKPGV